MNNTRSKLMKRSRDQVTRRRFLSSISSVAAAAAVLPRHTVAASSQLAPSEKLRLAFIGVGGYALAVLVTDLGLTRDDTGIAPAAGVQVDRHAPLVAAVFPFLPQ